MKQLIKFSFLLLILTPSLISYSQTGAIRINQLGYYPSANKIAMVVNSPATGFEIVNTLDNTVELTGSLSAPKYWKDAGDTLKQCDFSTLAKEGTFKIRIQGFGESYPFEISNTVYRKAAYASLKSYYYQRCSYELTAPYAGVWARAAGHPDTACVLHSSTGKSGKISSPGGWYDAGDYGKYVINAGISVATMLSFHENYSNFFEDGSIHIPESGNGKNDLLDEVKFELDWLKTMQDTDGGVFFKLTTLNFVGFVMPNATNATRYVIGKTSASALDFAAMMAMAGRIYMDYDSLYAKDCITRAENAWAWANSNPVSYFKNPSDVSTGEYGDGNVSDEFIWAAAELYITTGKDEFRTFLEARSSSLKYNSAPGWPNVQSLAALSLATRPNGLSESILTTIKNSVISTSDNWLSQVSSSPNRIPTFGFNWGSNSGIANIGVGLVYAYMLTNDTKYIRAAAECADYILGKNATGYSFVSSYGYKTPVNFHHRPSGSDGIIQPVPGFVSGGPNSGKQDNAGYPFSEPAKCFVDVTASYASNEVCINWNSPLTVLLAGVDAFMGDNSPVDFEVPVSVNNPPALSLSSPVNSSRTGSDQPLVVKGTATDPDGISGVELYIDSRFAGLIETSPFDLPLTSIDFGSHTLTLLAYDSKGLTAERTSLFTYYPVFDIPGKIQAEDYSNMKDIITQPTTDTDGGLNVSGVNATDFMDYSIVVPESGDYLVELRIASSAGRGSIEIRKSTQVVLATIPVESTGGSQVWVTLSDTITLSAGKQIIRLYAAAGGWNINWINFVKLDPVSVFNPGKAGDSNSLRISPNPFRENIVVNYAAGEMSAVDFLLFDMGGRIIKRQRQNVRHSREGEFEWTLDHELPSGEYYIGMMQNGIKLAGLKILKTY